MPDVAEAPVAAPAAPAVAAATPSSSPATSSTPSSTPEPSSAATPVAAPSGAPAASAELKADDFSSLEDYAQALIEQRQAKAAAEVPPAPETIPEAAPEGEAQPPDGIVPDGGEQPPAAEVIPELKLEDLQKPLEGEVTLEGIATVQDLYEKISADPATMEAMNKAGITGVVFDTVRKLDHVAKAATKEVDGYREFAPTVEDARYQRDQSVNFMNLDNAFLGAADGPQGVDNFLSTWREMAIIVDANGRPVPRTDAAGNPIPDGRGGYLPQLHDSYFKTFDRITEQRLFAMEKYASPEDTDLLAAIGVIRERMSPPSPAVDDLPEEQQKLLTSQKADLQRREEALRREQQDQQKAVSTRFINEVAADSTRSIAALYEPALEKANITGLTRKAAQQEIEDKIVASMERDGYFRARKDALMRLPQNAETKRQLQHLNLSHAQRVAGPIIRSVLAQAATPVLEKKVAIEKTATKVATQVANTRSEPRSTTGAVPQAAKMDPAKQFEQIKTAYKSEHGEEPTEQQLIELWTLARRRSA